MRRTRSDRGVRRCVSLEEAPISRRLRIHTPVFLAVLSLNLLIVSIWARHQFLLLYPWSLARSEPNISSRKGSLHIKKRVDGTIVVLGREALYAGEVDF